MEGRRFIESIRLDRILSFGPNDEEFVLEPLNVLIGPNASGKSNFIEALYLLRAAPWDLQMPIRQGGGVSEWLWKGESLSPTATIAVTVPYSAIAQSSITPIRYKLAFTQVGGRFFLVDEILESEDPLTPEISPPYIHYSYSFQGGHPMIDAVSPVGDDRHERQLKRDDVKHDQSILSQRRDPLSYPELTEIGYLFQGMAFYTERYFGRLSPSRHPQKTDLFQGTLMADASNLSLVLSDIQNYPHVKAQIMERMRIFYPAIKDVTTAVGGGTVQIFFHEESLHHPIPATRLSDGSIQYLCLLAVLCHPNPPLVVCIEEPELGLHPDIIPEVAKLLIEASSRSQIFVTTHSDVLVDALSEVPEAVVVCEKVDGATQLRRLDKESLEPWLKEYGLGHLWTRGELGGNRW